jgi:hypothetical protein
MEIATQAGGLLRNAVTLDYGDFFVCYDTKLHNLT